MSVFFNRNTMLILSIYFVQGFISIGGISEFLLTKNLFEFSWVQIAMLGTLSTLAWSIKPLFGFLTDLLPLFGSRRKVYLILASLLPIFSYAGMTFLGTSFLPIALFSILASVGLGFSDVIADGIVVETSKKETIGKMQALCWQTKAVGIFFGSIFSGIILERQIFSSWMNNTQFAEFLQNNFPTAFPAELVFGNISLFDVRGTFFLMALLPIITLISACFFQEKKLEKQTLKMAHEDISLNYIFSALVAFVLTGVVLVSFSLPKEQIFSVLDNSQISSLSVIFIWSVWIFLYAKHLIAKKATTSTLLWAAAFLFLWRFTPSFGAPWSDYYFNQLKISQESMGLISSLQPLAWVIGGVLYTTFLDKFPVKKVLVGTVIFSVLMHLTDIFTATPAIGSFLGNLWGIKYFSAIILSPVYFLVHGSGAWKEIFALPSILHLAGVTTFLMEISFILSFIPLLKLAALVTPKGVEATNFAILASVMNLGLAFSSIFGGILYTHIEGTHTIGNIEFTGLHIAVLLAAFTSLICLPVLKKIKL